MKINFLRDSNLFTDEFHLSDAGLGFIDSVIGGIVYAIENKCRQWIYVFKWLEVVGNGHHSGECAGVLANLGYLHIWVCVLYFILNAVNIVNSK